VGANIAEGQDSYQGKEFSRYLDISIRSAIESDHWISTLLGLGQDKPELKELEQDNLETIKMLKGLKNKINDKRNQAH